MCHAMQEVASEPSLRGLASDAFRSFVRAYATHTSETKKAFHVRNLHLGHVAFAHALKVGEWGSVVCLLVGCTPYCWLVGRMPYCFLVGCIPYFWLVFYLGACLDRECEDCV